jgi:hypothetical protein
MHTAIVRTFIHLANAEQARAELLSAGFAAETGAVQGNFAIGDDPHVKGNGEYASVFKPKAQGDVRDCQMTVHAADQARADQAAAILERFGALDPDPAARAGLHH